MTLTLEKPAVRTRQLAEFVARLRHDPLPANVLQATKTVVIDGTGALVAASNPRYSTGKIISEFVLSQGGSPDASIVGREIRTSVVNAALANGTMGYACDIEPHHPEAILHPIAVMIPTALAVGETVNATGMDFLKAVAIGCEVEYRCSIALGPAELYALGFHPSAVCGAFGATAAAAYLLGLAPEAIVRAFGLAACQASGLMAWESDPTENARPFQMGVAARNGVTAALLAARGFGGPTAVFDHGHTVFRAFSRRSEPEALLADLGRRWDGILELAIKPYPCVAFLHPALDAVFEMLREGVRPDDIASIVMRFPRAGAHCVDGNPLKSHCAQYILAVAFANGELNVADIFEDQRLINPAVERLSRAIDVGTDDELDKMFPDFYATILEIRTRSGDLLKRRKDIARGYPEAPMSPEEVQGKFRTVVGKVRSEESCNELLIAAAALDTMPDLQRYAASLRGRG